MDVKSPQGFLDKVKMLPMLPRWQVLSQAGFHWSLQGSNQTRQFFAAGFPYLQCWPKDAGRFITLPCVIPAIRRPASDVGMYRMQIYDERTTGMHWQRQKVGAEHYREALRTAARPM